MGKPKRIKVYAEASGIADLWKLSYTRKQQAEKDFCKRDAISTSLKPGPKKAVMPALVFHHLTKEDAKMASDYLKAIVDATVRD